jgi:hypothetical protein
VATLDGDGLKWIKGSPQFFSLPGSLSVPLSLEGRIIAFRLGRALV